MKKYLVIVVIAIALPVGVWMALPLFYDRHVNESLDYLMASEMGVVDAEQVEDPVPSRSGGFIGKDGHSASGTASIYELDGKFYLRLEDDFATTNGPDLFLHLGNGGKYDSDARIARLKGNIGGQNYEIPAEINPADFSEVWIWCRTFSVAFGVAELK